MGVCFFCPNGHPLNVKNEFAGKKGYCPICRVRMRIPMQSMREKDDKIYRGQPTAEALPEKRSNSRDDHTPSAPEPTKDSLVSRAIAESYRDDRAQRHSTARAELDGADSLWYVVVSESQTYGPATTAQLQTWVAERRVGAQTQLRRTDWNHTVAACEVLAPEIFGGTPERGAETPREEIRKTESAYSSLVFEPASSGLVERQRKATRVFYALCFAIVVLAVAALALVFIVARK